MIKKETIIKAGKISIGAFLAITIAYFLGLQNSVTAGIITILSIQNTKKETLNLAAKRMAAFAIALALAFASYLILGYTTFAFALYLLFYAGICIVLKMEENIAVCSVLISHFLVVKTIAVDFILNQVLILVIGAGVGVLINLFANTKLEEIRKSQQHIDDLLRNLLFALSKLLLHKISNEEIFKMIANMKTELDKSMLLTKRLEGNYLLEDYSYYPKYIGLRMSQLVILERFSTYNHKPNTASREEMMIAKIVEQYANSVHECNDGTALYADISELIGKFRESELPKTRDEFESRAILYGQLTDLDNLLALKQNFLENLNKKQKMQYWKWCSEKTQKI